MAPVEIAVACQNIWRSPHGLKAMQWDTQSAVLCLRPGTKLPERRQQLEWLQAHGSRCDHLLLSRIKIVCIVLSFRFALCPALNGEVWLLSPHRTFANSWMPCRGEPWHPQQDGTITRAVHPTFIQYIFWDLSSSLDAQLSRPTSLLPPWTFTYSLASAGSASDPTHASGLRFNRRHNFVSKPICKGGVFLGPG
jgi:hypothetical protein